MYKSIFITIMFILSFSSMYAATDVESMKTFIGPDKSYEFQYPEDWTEKKDLEEGFDLFIQAPQAANGRSYANLSIMSGDLPKSENLNSYTKSNIKHLMDDNKTIKVIDQGDTTIDEHPAKFFHYTRENDQTEIIHYFFVVDDTAYLITGGAAKEAYSRYHKLFETMAHSFKISD